MLIKYPGNQLIVYGFVVLSFLACKPVKLQGSYCSDNSPKTLYTNLVLKDNGEYVMQGVVSYFTRSTVVETGKYFLDGEKIRFVGLKLGYSPHTLHVIAKPDTSMGYALFKRKKIFIYKNNSEQWILKKSKRCEQVILTYKPGF
ncbi:hypothetical protein QNI19_17875 [Cytophagaceae bacterium DM2B3-1]|uniref:Lipoprotein n=1 Tax=Xanthocytophaga flava TaxID=3048013 RepID=A0ABT7CM45_9BACT|nr:hypothetical protein [Xanthocytophaga flavus]MDJ1494813.1 hypothetical protein [Xanthocytophaga flavus]